MSSSSTFITVKRKEKKLVQPISYTVPLYSHGYHVLWLPPYHPDLNPIEEAWGVTKGHVAYENDGSSFALVSDLIDQGFQKAEPLWAKLVRRAIKNESRYILEDRIHLYEGPCSPLMFETDTEDDSDIEESEENEQGEEEIDWEELGDEL